MWIILWPYLTMDKTTRASRSVFAHHAAKDNALAIVVCEIAKSAAVLHVKGGGGTVVQ